MCQKLCNLSRWKYIHGDGDAEIAGVENAGVEIARVDKVWQAKVLTCISDYVD